MRQSGHGRTAGFSLIELLAAVAVAGIVGAIAIPSYTQYVGRSHRETAKALMGESAQFMERYFTTNNTYVGATLPSAVAPRNASGADIRYQISFSVDPTAEAYTLQAVPNGRQVGDKCGTMTLSSTGAQAAAASGCWQ
ncbi:MAG: type IV pilin protein [Telluria sp.]